MCIRDRDNASEAEDGVKPAGLRRAPGRLRQFKRTRNVHLFDVRISGTSFTQRHPGGIPERAGDPLIETRHDDGETEACGSGQCDIA